MWREQKKWADKHASPIQIGRNLQNKSVVPFIPDDRVIIVVIANGMYDHRIDQMLYGFMACGIAYNMRELEAFNTPGDSRQKWFYHISIEKVMQYCPDVVKYIEGYEYY